MNRNLARTIKLSLFIIVFFHLGVNAQIPTNVKATLTANLETLAVGWDGNAVSSANAIFSDYQAQPVSEWVDFFEVYFDTRDFTNDLNNYFGYPTFFWLSNQARSNLQTSLNIVFQSGIYSALNNNENTSQWKISLQNKIGFLGNFFKHDLANTSSHFNNIALFCLDLANTYPDIFNQNNYVDQLTDPYLGNVRVQLHANLASYNYHSANMHSDIKQALGIDSGSSVDREALWDDFGIIVSDNGIYSNLRLEKTQFVFTHTPSNMHRVVIITASGVTSDYNVITVSGFNTFDLEIGAYNENSFPDDISPHYADGTTLVLCHELAHNLDSYGLEVSQPYLALFRDEILAAAGSEQLNYLRSMFDSNFFINAPQEFIASIGNQYYSNTIRTLELGVQRFQIGFQQPINQFLLFANMMSGGTDETNFFEFDVEANFFVETKIIEKNNDGHIVKLYITETCFYEFIRDSNNHVVQIIEPIADCETLSIEDLVNPLSTLNFYPNPFQNKIYLDFNSSFENLNVELTSILGSSIYSNSYKNNSIVELSFPENMAKGIYFLNLNFNNKKTRTIKLVKN